jgi:hypothetical protein
LYSGGVAWRGEQRGHDGDRQPPFELAGRQQHASFRFELEPVPRLDLDRGHALLQQRAQSRLAASHEFVDVGGARRADGVQDSAAFARDVGVTRARRAAREFRGTLPAEHDVGVAVDQARCDPAAGQFDRAVRRKASGQVRGRADPRDRVAVSDDRTVRERAAIVIAGEQGQVAPDASQGVWGQD